MALVRTDYGLIYNTDGSLCATLLPEGGVAVTEGTTNIAHGKIIYDTTPPVPVPGYPNALAKYTTTTSDLVMTLDPEVQAHSVQAWVYMAEDWDFETWEFRFLRNDSTVGRIPADPTKKGQWQHVKGTFTGSADQVELRSRGNGTHRGRWTAMVQIEEKPFATSFVNGSRPLGSFKLNRELFTVPSTISLFAKVPPTAGNTVLFDYANTFSGTLIQVKPNTNVVTFQIWDTAVRATDITVPDGFFERYHCYTVVYTSEGARYYIDGEQKATTTRVPSLDRLEFSLGVSPNGSNASSVLFDELLILPYAASEEEIVSWYEVQGPLPPHPQALLQWDRQVVRPAQMVKL